MTFSFHQLEVGDTFHRKKHENVVLKKTDWNKADVILPKPDSENEVVKVIPLTEEVFFLK